MLSSPRVEQRCWLSNSPLTDAGPIGVHRRRREEPFETQEAMVSQGKCLQPYKPQSIITRWVSWLIYQMKPLLFQNEFGSRA